MTTKKIYLKTRPYWGETRQINSYPDYEQIYKKNLPMLELIKYTENTLAVINKLKCFKIPTIRPVPTYYLEY